VHAHPQALVLGRLLAAHGIIEALGDEQRIVEFLCAVIGHIPGVKAVHACLYGERLPSAPPWENPCRNCRRLADTGESCCTLNTLPGAHLYYLRASFRSQGVIGVLTGGDAGFEFADPHVHNAVVTAATVMENRRLVRTIERESAERFERLVSSVPGVFYRRVFRGEWLHELLGRRISHITGYPATDCMLGGRHELGGLLDPEDRAWLRDRLSAAAAERRGFEVSYRVLHADRTVRWVCDRGCPVFDEDDRLESVEGFLNDITEQKAIEEALRESNERFQLVARATSDSVWDWDIRRNTLRQHNHFDSSVGDRSTDSGEIPWTERVHPDDRERVMDGVFAAIKGDKNDWSDEYRLGRCDGSYAQVEDRGFIIRDGQGRAVRMVGATLDISERKGRDPLTGLPNRALLLDRLTQTLALAEREQRPSAVLFLDLDRFKAINDSLGHAVGDELLRQTAERLRAAIRKEDTVARIGGDEFVILMAEIGDAENAAGIASKVLAALRVPFVIEEHELSVSASCGIAMSPADGTEAPVLLQRADTALYQCKADGGGGYRLFDREIDRRAHARLQLEQGLRRAIEHGEFFLHYQAQIDLASGTVTGAEALVRWQHPEGRLVPPGEFIPLAENMGYIGAIGEWVLREACTEALRWPPLRVSVNVSARQLTQPNFTSTAREILEETGLPPGRLEIEITESALMSDPARAIATLEELQELGIQIAMDDFGTGYSSLGQLKRLPLQRLKIDKSFVQDVPKDPNEVVIVEAILGLARQLNRIVVAEGVETESQLAFLRERGCDEAQGYLIAKPVPATEFRALLKGTNFLPRELPTDSQ
jgi:diguanylate cyclase (GGDEF)-like protein/PAS domain S-box-containing protein